MSAAYLFRQKKPDARILILDNHDDFGGHAKRNEFYVNTSLIIGYGGSQSMESPGAYSDVAKRLLSELTVDLKVFDQAFDQRFFRRNGLAAGVCFDQATYGHDTFVPASFLFNAALMDFAPSKLSIEEALASMPLDEESRRQLAHLMTVRADTLPDIGFTEVESYLSSICYETFLTQHAEVSSETVRDLLRRTTTGYFGLGTDAAPALDAMLFGLPGLNKTGIPGAQWLANQAIDLLVEPSIFHYPDGNATVDRLLARWLIPEWSDQSTAEGMVKAVLDYPQLDRPEHNVQIRLLSTAINVTNWSDGVDLIYRRHGQSHRVRVKNAVLACYNMMVPHLCPELPAPQCAALSQLVKVPLVYTNVVPNNWHAIKAPQMGFAYTPSSLHSYCMVDFPVSTPGYDFARTPDDRSCCIFLKR